MMISMRPRWLIPCLLMLSGTLGRPASALEVIKTQGILNGSFDGCGGAVVAHGCWRGAQALFIKTEAGNRGYLSLPATADVYVSQPLGAWPEYTDRLVLRGRVRRTGPDAAGLVGRLILRDASGATVAYSAAALEQKARSSLGQWARFAVPVGTDFLKQHGRKPQPRLTVELMYGKSSGAPGSVDWDDLEAEVYLPCPSQKEYRQALAEELRWLLAEFDRYGSDRTGIKHSFDCIPFDVRNGQPLRDPKSLTLTHDSLLWTVMQWACVAGEKEWVALAARQAREAAQAFFVPETGAQCAFNFVTDKPETAEYVFPWFLDYFFQAFELTGDEDIGRKALQAARLALEQGRRPDGTLAPTLRPGGGESPSYARGTPLADYVYGNLTALTMGRAYALSGDRRFLQAALDCARWVETHFDWKAGAQNTDMFNVAMGDMTRLHFYTGEPAFLNIAERVCALQHPWEATWAEGTWRSGDSCRSWDIFAYVGRKRNHPEYVNTIRLLGLYYFNQRQDSDGWWKDGYTQNWDWYFPYGPYSIGDEPGNNLSGMAVAYSAAQTKEQLARAWCNFQALSQGFREKHGYVHRFERAEGNAVADWESTYGPRALRQAQRIVEVFADREMVYLHHFPEVRRSRTAQREYLRALARVRAAYWRTHGAPAQVVAGLEAEAAKSNPDQATIADLCRRASDAAVTAVK